MILTNKERRRFIDYLRESAVADDMVARQLDGLGPFQMTAASRYHREADAALVIAAKLESTQTETT